MNHTAVIHKRRGTVNKLYIQIVRVRNLGVTPSSNIQKMWFESLVRDSDSVKRTTVNSRFTASGSREAEGGEKVVSLVCCTVNTFRLCGFRFVD